MVVQKDIFKHILICIPLVQLRGQNGISNRESFIFLCNFGQLVSSWPPPPPKNCKNLHNIIFIQSYILRLQMGSTTFKMVIHKLYKSET